MTRPAPTTSRSRRCAIVLLAAITLGFLWHQVFVMIGLLWWDAPAGASPVKRPDPPNIGVLNTSWVDVDAYLRNYPVWQH